MSLLEYLDEVEKDEFIWILCAFLAVIIPGFIIGFIIDKNWIIYTAIIVSGVFVIWSGLIYYANFHYKKKETEILKELPSFPVKDFCDICGKSLDGAEKRTDGEYLAIVCPHCDAENIVSNEETIESVSEEISSEENSQE